MMTISRFEQLSARLAALALDAFLKNNDTEADYWSAHHAHLQALMLGRLDQQTAPSTIQWPQMKSVKLARTLGENENF